MTLAVVLGIVAVLVLGFFAVRNLSDRRALAVAIAAPSTLKVTNTNAPETDAEELARILACRANPVVSIDPSRDPLPLTLNAVRLGELAGRYLGSYVGRLTDCAEAETSPIAAIMENKDFAEAASEMFQRWTVACSRLNDDAPELAKSSHKMMRDLRGAYVGGFDTLAWEASEAAKDVIETMQSGKRVNYSPELKLCASAAPLYAAQFAGIYTVPKIVRLASLALAQQGTTFTPRPKDDKAPATKPAPAKRTKKETAATA